MTTLEAAEMASLYHTGKAAVNLAYTNEVADACTSLDLNPHEIFAALEPPHDAPAAPTAGVGGRAMTGSYPNPLH